MLPLHWDREEDVAGQHPPSVSIRAQEYLSSSTMLWKRISATVHLKMMIVVVNQIKHVSMRFLCLKSTPFDKSKTARLAVLFDAVPEHRQRSVVFLRTEGKGECRARSTTNPTAGTGVHHLLSYASPLQNRHHRLQPPPVASSSMGNGRAPWQAPHGDARSPSAQKSVLGGSSAASDSVQ